MDNFRIVLPQEEQLLKSEYNFEVLGNGVLYDMCKEYADHIVPEAIYAKLWLIGRSYSAAIERNKSGEKTEVIYRNTVDELIKIGKAGSNSGARFLSQHYNPKSANSTLAASLLKDSDMSVFGIDEANVKDWIKCNCKRIDIVMDSSLGVFALGLVEAVLHYYYEPKYEGFNSQR